MSFDRRMTGSRPIFMKIIVKFSLIVVNVCGLLKPVELDHGGLMRMKSPHGTNF